VKLAEIVERPTRAIAIAGHSIYSILLPVPVVCFTGALITDFVYTRSENLMWSNFSAWMILAGLVVGFVAGIFLLIDFGRTAIARTGAGWISLFFFLAAWIIEIFNMLIHNQDGWTSVVPAGIVLSIIATVLIWIAGWLYRPALVVAAP
jgi:uncharacterized membrane protein